MKWHFLLIKIFYRLRLLSILATYISFFMLYCWQIICYSITSITDCFAYKLSVWLELSGGNSCLFYFTSAGATWWLRGNSAAGHWGHLKTCSLVSGVNAGSQLNSGGTVNQNTSMWPLHMCSCLTCSVSKANIPRKQSRSSWHCDLTLKVSATCLSKSLPIALCYLCFLFS